MRAGSNRAVANASNSQARWPCHRISARAVLKLSAVCQLGRLRLPLTCHGEATTMLHSSEAVVMYLAIVVVLTGSIGLVMAGVLT